MLKIIVTVPVEHASKLREAMFDAGAGNLGNYSCCSFSQKGIGRFNQMKMQILRSDKQVSMKKSKKKRLKLMFPKKIFQK